MSDGRDQGRPTVLPRADGPLVDVALPDGQRLYAVVKSRRKEADGSWWYDLQIHLPCQGSEQGQFLILPAAVDFRAPAALCAPIDGQRYDQVPTERYGVEVRWRIEKPAYFGTTVVPVWIVHRGDCQAVRDISRPATKDQARAALERQDSTPCSTCRPDRPLRNAV